MEAAGFSKHVWPFIGDQALKVNSSTLWNCSSNNAPYIFKRSKKTNKKSNFNQWLKNNIKISSL